MVYNKKAISPVVATALLLVVAVVAVVGFQSWFQTYNSGLTADVEQRSANTQGVTVERLEINGSSTLVWIKNAGTSAVTGIEIKVGTCTLADAAVMATSVNETEVDTTECGLTAGNTADVILVTSSGVYTETEIVR